MGKQINKMDAPKDKQTSKMDGKGQTSMLDGWTKRQTSKLDGQKTNKYIKA